VRNAVFLSAALIALAGSAHADDATLDPAAKTHLDKGLELYGQKKFSEAIAEFEQGYAIDPKPAILYALAQAERLDGRCSKAIEHYQAFLDKRPEPEREAAARANMARCKDLLAAKAPPETPPAEPAPTPAPAPAPTPAPVAPAPPPTADRAPAETSPWYSDTFGDVLTGAGVVALGVGGYFFFVSKHNESVAQSEGDAPSGATYQQHLDRVDRAERQRTIAVVSGSVGLGLITAGVLRYVLRSPEPEKGQVGAWLGAKSGGVSVGGRF
jgi:tetratricopeptide (TPR) repeat protein